MSSYSSTTDHAENVSRSSAENTGAGSLNLPAVSPIQKMGEDEEPAQAKADPIQKAGLEEEPVQGKFEPVQKMEDEEEPV